MSGVKQFTIGGTNYNAAMASAIDQDKILSHLTQPLIERALSAARLGQELDNKVLVPMFLAMPSVIKEPVANMLLARTVVHGTAVPVTVDSFHGKMVQYNTLLADLLRWNLSDFFAWLPAVLADDRATDAPETAP